MEDIEKGSGEAPEAKSEDDRDTWQRVDHALSQALDQPADDREAWVRRQFADAPGLRDAVLWLLKSDRASDELFAAALSERDAIASEALDGDPSALGMAGERLGAYQLTDLIATGGMAAVYRAERDDGQYAQTVAVKILPAWVTDEQMVRRLRAERQILSSLRHPHITRLLDGGQTGDGYPYLVTEYIDGQELIHYARDKALSLEDRLDLFLKIAEAVQYAHEQGVIHRDLKPANILVDSQGRPHLLDFGIAKLTEQSDIALSRLRTTTGFTPMTPEYASPEQLAGADVGRASDIYQLGLLLYELLAGQRAVGTGVAAAGVVTRPSTAVRSRSDDEGERSGELQQRARKLRGDLDTVVLKALRQEPEARYRSARAMARDIRHFRAGEAIEARPEPLWSAGRRLARHYPVAASLIAGMLVLLLAWAGSLSFYADELERQRDEAERQARRAERSRDVLIDVFRRSDPLQADSVGGAGASVWDSLDAAALESRMTLADDPETLAELLSTLATLQNYAGNTEEYRALVEESMALYERLGPAYRGAYLEQAVLLAGLLEETDVQRSRELREVVVQGLQEPVPAEVTSVVNTLVRLGFMDGGAGDFATALTHFDRALAVLDAAASENWSLRIEALFGRGQVLQQLGQLDEAASSLVASLALTEAHFGDDHGRLTGTLSAMSSLERLRGNAEASIEWGERLVDVMSRNNAPESEGLLAARNNLALAYLEAGRYTETQSELSRLIDIRRASGGKDGSRALAINLKNLASTLIKIGDLSAARAAVQEARMLMERHYPAGSPIIATSWFTLGQIELAEGALAPADTAFQGALAILEPALGGAHVQVHITRCYLAEVRLRQGQIKAAKDLARPALAGIAAAEVRYPDHEQQCMETTRALDG